MTDRDGPDRRDQAVSSIVAAVLLLALFTTVFTLWTVSTLPGWIADREEAHAESVQRSFLDLQAGLDALSASEDGGPTSVAIDLGPRPVPILQASAARGQVEMEGTTRVVAGFTNERVLVQDGTASVTPDAPISGSGETVDDIEELAALVVLLETTGVDNGETAWVEIVADDGEGTVTGRITHAGKTSGSGPNVAGCLNSELRLEVTTDIAPVLPTTTTQALLCELADELTGYTVDLGLQFSPFAQAIGRLEPPFSITLTEGGSGGTAIGWYGVAFFGPDGFGSTGSGAGADIAIDETRPRLKFDPGYQEFDGPAEAWELGALVLEQDDGSSIDAAAGFRLAFGDGLGELDWTLVLLDGSGGRGGAGTATVQVRHERTQDFLVTADGGTFTLTTPAAQAWRDYFADRALLAGIEDEVTVGGTGDTVTLTLEDAGVDEWIIHLRIVSAELAVT